MINTYIRFLYNLFRIFFKKIFFRVNFSGSKLHSFSKHTLLNFQKGSNIYFGKNIQSDGFCRLVVGKGANLTIGQGTYFNSGCVISSLKQIVIGENCLFGPNVVVFDNNHKFDSKNGVSFEHSCESITIGNNCWIASNVIILKGTTIGDNCVIGAGCKVSGNIPDGTIVTQSTELHMHTIEDR